MLSNYENKYETINPITKENLKKKIKHINYKALIYFSVILLIVFFIMLIIENKKLKSKNIELIKEKNTLTKKIEKLTYSNLFFKQVYPKNEFEFYKLLCPKKVIDKKKVMYGNDKEGGYVLFDDIKDIKIAYSFGISTLLAFDKALADKGIDVYMYDHTIDYLVLNHSKFHWKKIGLASELKKDYNKKTLTQLLIENGYTKENNMILKIDIEGDEWGVLQEISEEILNQFKYILIEIHLWDVKNYQLYYFCLEKLQKTHQVYHIHCCNCFDELFVLGQNPICKPLEVSYIRKEGNKFEKDNDIYPIKGFDFLTCPYKPSQDKEANILKYCDS